MPNDEKEWYPDGIGRVSKNTRKEAADDMLKLVDEQLLKHGPNRAIALIQQLSMSVPGGNRSRFSQYRTVLEGIVERHKK